MITPYKDEAPKVEQVQRMFNRIAPTYDRLNRIISLGLDKSWRKQALALLEPYKPSKVLDVATGTGDLAIELITAIPSIEEVLGVDISEEMMRVGKDKVHSLGLDEQISFAREDCTALSLEDNSFDAVTIAFGIRNFADIPRAAKEIYRVLRPGKPVVILELTEPENFIMRMGYKLYAGHFIPLVGRLISDDDRAYKYLPESIAAVPQREAMTRILEEAGFGTAYYQSLTPGTCAIYVGIK